MIFTLNSKKNYYDIILSMEAVEHFKYDDAIVYIENMAKSLKKNGRLIGTSSFPFSKQEAMDRENENAFHLNIFTHSEFFGLLKSFFRDVTIINNWMFMARKRFD